MNRTTILAACLLAISLAAGCAQTNVSNRESTSTSEVILKPARVIVYDFASTPAAVPPDSAIAGLYRQRTTPQTPEEISLGRRLGARVSAHLVAATGPVPHPGDAVIRGEFVSIDKGNRTKRMLIGFGAGAARLETLVEGYVVTTTGLVPLGSAQIETAGGKMPGMLVPIGAGAAAGRAATSAAISGAGNVLQELGPEGLDGAATRTAKEIAKLIVKSYKERGWL